MAKKTTDPDISDFVFEPDTTIAGPQPVVEAGRTIPVYTNPLANTIELTSPIIPTTLDRTNTLSDPMQRDDSYYPEPGRQVASNGPIAPSYLLAPNSLSGGITPTPTPEVVQNPSGVDPKNSSTWAKDAFGHSIPPPLGAGVVHPGVAGGASSPSSPDDALAKQSVLNKIASGEATSYNEIYGGGSFNDYSDHPRQKQVITEGPHKGEYSDAAGLYQFMSSTWDQEKGKLGLKDFSPSSQDAAAWDLASTTYKNATGRNLLADSKAGNVKWTALAGQWSSLAGSEAGPGMTSRSPKGGKSSPGGNSQDSQVASGTPADTSGLLRLALLQAAFPQHQFTPVQYDPFKIEQAEHVG